MPAAVPILLAQAPAAVPAAGWLAAQAAAPLAAGWVERLALPAFLLAAEALAATAAWMEKALEAHTHAGLMEAGDEAEAPERALEVLRRLPTFLLSARILRFLAKAALVVGVASWSLGDDIREGLADGAGFVPVPWSALGVALLLAFLVNFVVNDVLVGVLARRHADRRLVASLGLLRTMAVLTAPVRVPLRLLVRGVFRVSIEEPAADTRDEVLESVREGEEEGSVSPAEAGMIEAVMSLPSRTVRDVLVPRAQVSMLQADTPLVEAARFAAEDGHTRLPVYGRDRDEVLGWVHARDLLRLAGEGSAASAPVRTVMREPFFVPEGKPLDELLEEMRSKHVHLAVALNDLGATAGVVSLEDVLEQIVGDIQDELDADSTRALRPASLARGDMQVDARLRVEDVNRLLRLDLPLLPEAYETLGGLLLHRIGHVPQAGESLDVAGATLSVLEADPRKVKRVLVQLRKGGPTPSASA